MTKKLLLILIVAVIALGGIVSAQQSRIKKIKKERDTELHNKDVLLGEASRRYKVADSLSAISSRELVLSRREFEKYRSETAQLISELEVDKKNLENVTSMQAQTIHELRGVQARVVTDTVYMPGTDMRVIEHADKWLDLMIKLYADDTADVDITSRESLVYTEWIKRKKFLWFRYGVKERKQEIVSLNPNTEIISSEFITIKQ